MKETLRKLIPHLLIVLGFVAISLIYFYPVLEGYTLKQGDIVQYKGMSKEIMDFREAYNEEPIWTNSMFAGMPAYQIAVEYPVNVFRFVDQKIMTLGLGRPANFLFLYMLGFYLLLLVFKIKPPLAAVGSVAFAFASYYLIILLAGHNTKAHAIGYMAPALAGIVLTYRGKWLLGGALTAFFLAMEINANHVQITYYFAMLVVFYGLARLVEAVKEKTTARFFKASGIVVAAAILAVLSNANMLWNTYDYGKDTMRGKTELTIEADGTKNTDNATAGLDRDYVTQWSSGIAESFSLLIPNIKGGESGILIDEDTQRENPQFYQMAVQMYQQGMPPNQYWGDQPFTSGPVYAGAIVCLLFVLGLFYVNGPWKWALLATFILTLALSWGKNFMGLTDFFLDYVPLYNKFRAVTIILSVTTFAMCIMAFLFIKKVVETPEVISQSYKKFFIISGSLGGLLLLFLMLPEAFFDFLSQNEKAGFGAQLANNASPQLSLYVDELKEIRVSRFRGDVFRSLLFVLGAAAGIYLFVAKKLKWTYFTGLLFLLILIDLWPVAKRYLNNEKDRGRYVQWQQSEETAPFEASQADLAILNREIAVNPYVKDAVDASVEKARAEAREENHGRIAEWQLNNARFAALRFTTDYRVLKLGNPFQDASASYFHKSIGGYHGAKLKRYQELINFHLAEEINNFISVLKTQPSETKLQFALDDLNILNMLNTKYIIYSPEAAPIENTANLGPAWMVEEIKVVENADEEIKELGSIFTSTTAVVDKRFAEVLDGFTGGTADGELAVETHLPNRISYIYNSGSQQAVIFSEIYYDKGWNAYLDGEKVPYFRANYVLRGMVVPSGEHTIEFRFEPQAYATASTVTTVSSVLVLLLLVFSLYKQVKTTVPEED